MGTPIPSQDRAKIRRAALLEAAAAVCWYCGEGHVPTLYNTHYIHVFEYGAFGCSAKEIHNLLAQSQPQE